MGKGLLTVKPVEQVDASHLACIKQHSASVQEAARHSVEGRGLTGEYPAVHTAAVQVGLAEQHSVTVHVPDEQGRLGNGDFVE